MVTSVANEGVRGLQNSQREIVRAASEIARANVRPDATNPVSETNTASPLAPVEESAQSEPRRDIAEPLIELRRQEQVFNASAEVTSTENRALGSLLDTSA